MAMYDHQEARGTNRSRRRVGHFRAGVPSKDCKVSVTQRKRGDDQIDRPTSEAAAIGQMHTIFCAAATETPLTNLASVKVIFFV